jgi:hypothetical protein
MCSFAQPVAVDGCLSENHQVGGAITVSDFPSLAPSDYPSSMPSDSPSSFPSVEQVFVAKSVAGGLATTTGKTESKEEMVQSDAPSLVPSDAPSTVPSDMPSAPSSEGLFVEKSVLDKKGVRDCVSMTRSIQFWTAPLLTAFTNVQQLRAGA